jgi:hypothetical protein
MSPSVQQRSLPVLFQRKGAFFPEKDSKYDRFGALILFSADIVGHEEERSEGPVPYGSSAGGLFRHDLPFGMRRAATCGESR